MEINTIVLQILEENGIYISEDLDADLDMDSITFISIIVCFENQLGIYIPDEYLTIDKFKTINDFVKNITEIIEGQQF